MANRCANRSESSSILDKDTGEYFIYFSMGIEVPTGEPLAQSAASHAQSHEHYHASSSGLDCDNPNRALAQIAREQTPVSENRRPAAMKCILRLVSQGKTSDAEIWSTRLLGGAVPPSIAAGVCNESYMLDIEYFYLVDRWVRLSSASA